MMHVLRKSTRSKSQKKYYSGKLDDNVHINTTWENIRHNINISGKESLGHHKLKKHKSWSEEECLNYKIKGSLLNCSGCITLKSDEWIIWTMLDMELETLWGGGGF
jgi:hypothetical protein